MISDQKAISDMIVNTYDNLGLTILDIKPFAPGVFKVEMMNNLGVHDAYITVLLHLTKVENANN